MKRKLNKFAYFVTGMLTIVLLFVRHLPIKVHMVCGFLIIMTVAYHVWIHKKWIKTQLQNQNMSKQWQIRFWNDSLLFAFFSISIISGILSCYGETSNEVISYVAGFLHKWSSYLMGISLFIHIILHIKVKKKK